MVVLDTCERGGVYIFYVLFAMSTFNTDYLLIKAEHLEKACEALQVARFGFNFTSRWDRQDSHDCADWIAAPFRISGSSGILRGLNQET